MDEKEKLTIKDAENAQRAILELIFKYPDFPKTFKANNTTIKWDDIATVTSIGIFTLQGARYLKRYVSGSYTAQIPFQIVFRSSPSTNKDTINAQTLIDGLGEWLENVGIDFRDEHMKLENISRTSPSFLMAQNEKVSDYAVNMNLRYYYKK